MSIRDGLTRLEHEALQAVRHERQTVREHAAGWFHPYHRTDSQGEPVMHLQQLAANIENDLGKLGINVTQEIHGVLSGHLQLANVLDHAVTTAQEVQALPPVQWAEKWAGVPADFISRGLAIADEALHQLTTMGQVPAADPAQPAVSQVAGQA